MVSIRSSIRTATAAALALCALLALTPAAVAQEPTPPVPPPIPEVPTVPTMPGIPDVPEVPEVPKDSSEITDLVTPMDANMLLTAQPRRDATLPVTVRVNGWISAPKAFRGMANFFRTALGIDLGVCEGRVTIVYKAGGRTIATRTAAVDSTCRFSSRIVIRKRSRLGGARKLSATARFGGNDVLSEVHHSVSVQVR